MFTAAGFAKTWEYASLFKDGLICTIARSALTVVFGFVLALLLVGVRLFGMQVFTVLSGSMEPTYQTGSLIYVKDVDYMDMMAPR